MTPSLFYYFNVLGVINDCATNFDYNFFFDGITLKTGVKILVSILGSYFNSPEITANANGFIITLYDV